MQRTMSPYPLSDRFLSCAQASGWAACPELEGSLRDLLEAGRRAWPDLDLPGEAFAEHLGGLLVPEDAVVGVGGYGQTLVAADLYLACALLQGIDSAVEAFEQHHVARVPALLAHMNQPSATIADLQQELRERLLVGGPDTPPRIQQYSGLGSLAAWFNTVAVRAAITRLRTREALPLEREDRAIAALITETDPHKTLLRQRYGAAFEAALGEAIAGLRSDQRDVLYLYYADGLTTTQIGTMFRVHNTTVLRWLNAARAEITQATRRLFCARLQLESSAFGDVVQAVLSGIDLSLSGVLRHSRH